MKAHPHLILLLEKLAMYSAGGRNDYDAWADAGYPLWDSTGTLGTGQNEMMTVAEIEAWNAALEEAAVLSESEMFDCFYSEGRTRCADAIRGLKR